MSPRQCLDFFVPLLKQAGTLGIGAIQGVVVVNQFDTANIRSFWRADSIFIGRYLVRLNLCRPALYISSEREINKLLCAFQIAGAFDDTHRADLVASSFTRSNRLDRIATHGLLNRAMHKDDAECDLTTGRSFDPGRP